MTQKQPQIISIANPIGDKGASHLAELLKINKTLTEIYLELIQRFLFLSLAITFLKENEIEDDGAKAIAEGLKANSSIKKVFLKNYSYIQQYILFKTQKDLLIQQHWKRRSYSF